ncbi:MAG: hypothetical protein E6987_01560 [Peptoniphilus harei]|jgi:hypothetical protein|nr:hypothetical protein [Peptoniphilus harei]DAY50043.1 MAG TPA: hypothetical protein [Caudoviricetes sp.]
MAGALTRGLTLSDFKSMTIGDVVDYCIAYNNANYSNEDEDKDKVRKASQKDFDSF